MDCLVDIDKLIDDLEEDETLEAGNNIAPTNHNNRAPPVKNEFIPVSNVFSSLKDYVNAGKDIIEAPKEAENAKKNRKHHKFTNPNYEYNDDDYTSSDSDDLQEEMARRRAKNESHDASNDSTTSTSSPSGTTTTSGPESVSQTNSAEVKIAPQNEEDEEKLLETDENVTKNTTNVPENVSYGTCPVPQDAMSLSNTFSNDVINLEGMSSISSMVEITSNYKKLKSDCRDNDADTINDDQIEKELASITSDFLAGGLDFNEARNVTQKTETSKKPIGFESTMDDVSDTELESYLQELEDEANLNEEPKNEPEIGENLEEDTPEQSTGGTKDDDGDNVSKASTIEFNEMRTKEDIPEIHDVNAEDEPVECEIKAIEDAKPDIEPAMFQSLDSLRFADSATTEQKTTEIGSEVVEIEENEEKLEEIEEKEPKTDEKEMEPTEIEEKQEENAQENVPKVEVEEVAKTENEPEPQESQENAANLTMNDENASKASRPNSLDIQNVTSPVEGELAENLNNEPVNQPNSSPGHTPPPVSRSFPPEPDTGMTSSSSEDFSTPPSSSMANPADNPALQAGTNQLGKVAPYWVPDNMTNNCMQCNTKFSLIKRRHHCRSCGQLLCSACCCMKAKLEYMEDQEARICIQCDHILSLQEDAAIGNMPESGAGAAARQPNPNNPMEYCSVIPPHQQVSSSSAPPISVMVPVGVLKREGQSRSNRKDRNVIFSDGIRPGCDLTELDSNWDAKTDNGRRGKNRVQTPPGTNLHEKQFKINIKLPPTDLDNKSYIPKKENALPPIYSQTKTEYKFTDVVNDVSLITRLHTETLKFAVQRNFYVFVKIVKLTCCVNKTVINFTTKGLHHVGQDEIVILLELDESNLIPKDIFLHLNDIYNEADKGNTITELGFSMPKMTNFLGSKEHGGFLFIRTSFQCLQNVIVPEAPYLIGVLIHRWEVPWAKIFPLRLMLRLGALYRYYPTPHISVRQRDAVYAEIAQTIINFLADFRTYSYTIPTIRGMYIHMEDRKTSILIPRNRYDQVMKAINNSSDHILAIAGNFSKAADGHLVCIQNTEANTPEQLHSYSTQAINIQGQPRKITGASFIVLNGALKSSTGLSGKCNIVEDGLMVQISPTKMTSTREALKNMKDVDIICGPIDADPSVTETVTFQWTDNDLNFNIGVVSPIDKKDLSGVPSIRCHNSLLYSNANHSIRWAEVFIIKSDDDSPQVRDAVDIPRVAEQIARNTCQALVTFLNLLAANDLVKIGLRVFLDPENVSFEAGSQYAKLAPLYMNALDNELVPTLHRQASNLHLDTPIVLELIFHILDK
ncbi:zinc finger FYVE domain-containing protein 9 [Culicoides brevitarsis]|uniref:zinc finger FYVE domain-containing protein 9 n=1 Tax=Culicoides brevitarsis TaxID=469753 RepID=UPI00307B339B